MNRNRLWRVVIAASAFAALSCESSSITAPLAVDAAATRPLGIGASAKPLTCPNQDAFSATSLIGPLGGLLTAGGVTVSVPAGALLNSETVTLTVPASNYVEIDVSVAGTEHFVFESPIAVTVSYAQCNRSNIDASPLSAWYFDQATGDLLEQMPSVDNKLLRTVTFTTGHLSGYIIANFE